MNKITFKQIIQELVSLKNDEDNLNNAFRKLDTDFNYISFGRHEALIIKCLKEAINDEADWIGYWLYERDMKFTKKNIIEDKNGKKLPLRNLDDLYNLITK